MALKDKLQEDLGSWYEFMQEEVESEWFFEIFRKLAEVSKKKTVYPKGADLFNAFKFFNPEDTKCVILGQDPFHDGVAHGLCFSVDHDFYINPSLRNIFTEIERSVEGTKEERINRWKSSRLDSWAEQGVLLLNTILTVSAGEPKSHKKLGWQQFTRKVIEKLSNLENPPIFVLWGRDVGEYEDIINHKAHILRAPHPAAEAYSGGKAGFFGCNHFNEINRLLREQGREEINWYEV